MRLRPILAGITVAAVLGASAGVAVAQTASTTASGAVRMAELKSRGDSEINRRLVDLDGLTARINADHRINATQKSEVLGVVNATRTGLQALKTKIDGDTDLTTLRADVQAIVLNFRVYVLVDPMVHEIVASDQILDLTNLLTSIENRLSPYVTKLNNSSVTAAFSDAQQQTQAAAGLVGPLPAELAALTPAGYPGNKATLQSAHTALASARADLGKVRSDLATVIQALRPNGSASTTSSTA